MCFQTILNRVLKRHAHDVGVHDVGVHDVGVHDVGVHDVGVVFVAYKLSQKKFQLI